MRVPLGMLVAAAVATSAAIAGCASTDYHHSQLSGSRYHPAPIDTHPVSILRVDGREALGGRLTVVRSGGLDPTPRTFALVDPGDRQVTVQGPPGATGGVGATRTVTLAVAPCTRYYLVAVKPNPLASDFTVRVDHQEPVSGCTAARS